MSASIAESDKQVEGQLLANSTEQDPKVEDDTPAASMSSEAKVADVIEEKKSLKSKLAANVRKIIGVPKLETAVTLLAIVAVVSMACMLKGMNDKLTETANELKALQDRVTPVSDWVLLTNQKSLSDIIKVNKELELKAQAEKQNNLDRKEIERLQSTGFGGFVQQLGGLTVEKDGLKVTHTSNYTASIIIRTKESVSKGRVSFKVRVLDVGKENANIHIGCIGKQVQFEHGSVLGRYSKSWGYSSGGGYLTNNHNTGQGVTFTTGDNITVTMDFESKTIRFAKNGLKPRVAFAELDSEVYPAVSLWGKGASVEILTK